MNRTELLERASRCYQRAGLLDDAVRCMDASGQRRASARLLEDLGRYGDAAIRYEQAGAWRAASDCHRRSQQLDRCAECLLLDGDWLEAAWIFSHVLEQYARASTLVREHQPTIVSETPPASDTSSAPGGIHQKLHAELILARCAAGMGESMAAARLLWRLAVEFPTDGTAEERAVILDRSLIIATVLQRPDLTALLFAAGYRAGLPTVLDRWRRWAQESLGSTSGIPESSIHLKGAPHG